jgi:hypothetical protein
LCCTAAAFLIHNSTLYPTPSIAVCDCVADQVAVAVVLQGCRVPDAFTGGQWRLAPAAHQRRVQQELHDYLRELQVRRELQVEPCSEQEYSLLHRVGCADHWSALTCTACSTHGTGMHTVQETTVCTAYMHAGVMWCCLFYTHFCRFAHCSLCVYTMHAATQLGVLSKFQPL